MNTEQLKEIIESDEDSAYGLLYSKMPKAEAKFNRLSNGLAELLKEVKTHFPEARYYTSGGDGFVLVLGDTHSGRGESPNNDLVALSARKLYVQGGDW